MTTRKTAVWAGYSLAVTLTGLLVLWGTDTLQPVYRWMVRYFAPEVWSAIGTWLAVAVAIVTVLVVGRYAKQQVEKAQDQVDEARRTRELQAQPNVVLYSEPNPASWQILEVVVKNFGTTPAYDIKISITPQLQSSPNLLTDPKIANVPVPRRIPILVPGQSWRTVWDSALERKQHERELWQKLGKAEIPLLEYFDQKPNRRHHAVVTYTDSGRQERYQTEAELDFNMLDGTTRLDVKTIDDLTRQVEKAREELGEIRKILGGYSQNEHKGIWIYVKDADDERAYREAEGERIQRRLEERRQRYEQQRGRARDLLRGQDAEPSESP
ncbi:hypothetical protein [Mycobacterium intracellulare]|uniref:hypothetical protein n=1 Tax=Mycobacterium intracellulare TaxID=1767 RepID=UPI0034D1BCEB